MHAVLGEFLSHTLGQLRRTARAPGDVVQLLREAVVLAEETASVKSAWEL